LILHLALEAIILTFIRGELHLLLALINNVERIEFQANLLSSFLSDVQESIRVEGKLVFEL